MILDGIYRGTWHDIGLIFGLIDTRDAAPADDREAWDTAIDDWMTSLEEGDFA